MFFTDLLISMSCLLILVVCVLVGMAFFNFIRLYSFMGIPQPFSDDNKLFSKERTFPLLSNYIMYYYSPVMSLFLSMLMWVTMPYLFGLFMFNLS